MSPFDASPDPAAPPSTAARSAAFRAMVAAVARAATAPCTERPAAVAAALGAHAAAPDLLAGIATPCCAEHYLRHLLHEDAGAGWAIAALVWRPGQMSPVHAHRAWCAVAVHRGVLAESFYAAGEAPRPTQVALRRPGETTFGAADPRMIHRLANLGCETAISLHAYGLPFAAFRTGLNTVYAA